METIKMEDILYIIGMACCGWVLGDLVSAFDIEKSGRKIYSKISFIVLILALILFSYTKISFQNKIDDLKYKKGVTHIQQDTLQVKIHFGV
jgi:Ni/Fe-hydrogenase subunit HybB-like protein